MPSRLLGVAVVLIVAADWPQFLGPNRDGVAAGPAVRADWSNKLPEAVWSAPLGEGFSGPVIADGKLLVLHRLGNDDVADCHDALTGQRLWRFQQATTYEDDYGKGNGPRATPAIAEGRVFLFGADGRLTALEMATGKKLWTKAVNEQYQVRKGYFGAACSPLVEGGRVILNVGGRDAGVVAFDAATGEEVWRATRDGASYSSPVAATVAGRRWLFVFTRAGLAALDPADGTVRLTFPWRARIDASVNAAAPLVLDDRFVFLTSSYSTGAVLLDVTKEAAPVVWKSDDVLSCHYNTPVAAGDHLYGVDGRQEGDSAKLRCVDWKTGRVAWSRDDFGCAQIVRVGRQLLVLTENGELLLLDADPSAYKERARFQAAQGKPVRAPMALVEGRLYFRDARQLVCLDLRGR